MSEARTARPRRWWRHRVTQLALILSLGGAAYANSFAVPFQWDGIRMLRENDAIQGIERLRDPALCEPSQYLEQVCRRKVAYLSFALNYALHGHDVAGYHVVNLAVHLTNAILVYVLVLALFATPRMRGSELSRRRTAVAVCAACLFVAHPLQTMAVTYIYQRQASLVAMFYLLTVICYLAARRDQRAVAQTLLFGLALFSALLAINTKENAATLPFAIAMVELLLFDGSRLWRALWVAPFALVLLALPLPYISGGAAAGVDHAPYFFTQAKVLVAYLAMTLFPLRQSVVHEVEVAVSALDALVIGGGLVLLALVAVAVRCAIEARRGRPALGLVAFGLLWFFITQAVESSVFPLHWHMQEQRVYLSLAGLLPGLVAGSWLVLERLGGARMARATPVALLALALLFGGLSWRRNQVWQSEERLWQDVLEQYPHSAIAAANLGAALLKRGETARAVALLERASALDARLFLPRITLGKHYRDRGELDRAQTALDQALALRSWSARARFEAGFLALARGDLVLAERRFDQALERAPRDRASFYYCGVIRARRGEHVAAIACLERALALMPESADTLLALGLSSWEAGQRQRGMELLERAAPLRPDSITVLRALGAFNYALGRYREARARLERALELDPDDEIARDYLVKVYGQLGR